LTRSQPIVRNANDATTARTWRRASISTWFSLTASQPRWFYPN
jgi:hypothetical protein